jgi:hypothetical protein
MLVLVETNYAKNVLQSTYCDFFAAITYWVEHTLHD